MYIMYVLAMTLKLLYPYCWHGMHSRDIIDLLWFNVVHYSSLFQYFFDLLWSLL